MNDTLRVTTPSDREIAMIRDFDAPARLVWDAYTRPELLKRWLGVFGGWTMDVCEVDLRVGGKYRYVWRGPNGEVMGMGGTFLELVPHERIVATEKFDEPWYEGEAVDTTTFEERGGKTTMTTIMRLDSKEIRDKVLQSPMESGVAASYDQLAEVLASMPAKEA